MAQKRFRLQYKFWLDLNKQDEHELAEIIANLKQGRAFSQAVRDGIRLVADLWKGNLDVLLELFPGVEEAFYEQFQQQQPVQDVSLQEQLARLESLLLQQGNTPVATTNSGPKLLNVPKVAGPQFEDDDALIVMKKAKGDGSSAANFLNSALNLIQ